MSDETNGGDKKKARAICINENRVRLVGRVMTQPKAAENGKYTRAQLCIPQRMKDKDTQWFIVPVDVLGDQQAIATDAKNGDYMRVTCTLVQRKVKDTEGNEKNVLSLQVDDYDVIGLVRGEACDRTPKDDGMCVNEVILAGRNILKKKDRDAGKEFVEVRESKSGNKYAFLNVVYNDPRKPDDDGTFIDVSVFGKQAEFAGKYTKHNHQVLVVGELNPTETNFKVRVKKRNAKGEVETVEQTMQQLRVAARPYGMQSVGLAGGSGEAKAPSGGDASVYGDGEEPDQDLPF